MSNPIGDTASLAFLYSLVSLFFFFFVYRFYKCLRRNNSISYPSENIQNDEIIASRSSSIDKIFNDFNHSVNIKSIDSMLSILDKAEDQKPKYLKGFEKKQRDLTSMSCFEGDRNFTHINALLNLLTVQNIGENGLNDNQMYQMKKRFKIFTHEDLNSENLILNTTGNIEKLSKSFCLNNDANIRNKPSCMYCLENLNIGDRVIYLETCKHIFHDSCCCDWFSKKKYCPSCKKLPFSTDINQEYTLLNEL